MKILEALQNIAVIIASFAAIYGIDSWRREFVGRRRIELAEETLVLFYEARDAIRFMRSPLGYAGEGGTRAPKDDEFAEEKNIRNQAYVLLERYNQRQEVFSKIQASRYRFMAQLGIETTRPFDDLYRLILDLISAADQLAELRIEQLYADKRGDQIRDNRERIREVERVFWSGFQDDPIAQRIDAIVDEIERICRAEIDRSNTSASFLERFRKHLAR